MPLCGTEWILKTKLPYKFVLWTPQERHSTLTLAPPIKCVAPVTTSAIRNVSLELPALWRHHLQHMAMINFICRAANTNYRCWPTPCFQHRTSLTLPSILRSQKTVKLSSLPYDIRAEFVKKWLCVASGFVLMSYLNQQTVSLQRQHVISDVRRLRRVVARGQREVVCVRIVKAWRGRRGGAPIIVNLYSNCRRARPLFVLAVPHSIHSTAPGLDIPQCAVNRTPVAHTGRYYSGWHSCRTRHLPCCSIPLQ
jgi:hypothetical protein